MKSFLNNSKTVGEIAKHAFKAFGTAIELQVVVTDAIRDSLSDIFAQTESQYRSFEKIFSRFDEESELSKINAQRGNLIHASQEMRIAAEHALAYYEKTDGLFDPRIISALEESGYDKDFDSLELAMDDEAREQAIESVPLADQLHIKGEYVQFDVRMDFAGLVKGLMTDRVAHYLKSSGVVNFLVDSGGDIFASGHDEKNKAWYIDIEGVPYDACMLALSDVGVATSGIGKRKWERKGKRYHHLVNPKDTAQYSFDVKSVTAVAETTEDADVLAKTLFLMGLEAAKKFATDQQIPCAILNYRSAAWISPSLKNYLYQ